MGKDLIAFVLKRNGAWLIHFTTTAAADRPEDANFDVASSLAVAKRIAKEGARSEGATHLKWRETPEYGGWVLEGIEGEWEG